MLNENRRTGRTTRLIDGYIQQLFEEGSVLIKDHHDSPDSHCYLFRKVLARLKAEHRFQTMMDNKWVVVDEPTLQIIFTGNYLKLLEEGKSK